jgi:hypothetical protein
VQLTTRTFGEMRMWQIGPYFERRLRVSELSPLALKVAPLPRSKLETHKRQPPPGEPRWRGRRIAIGARAGRPTRT